MERSRLERGGNLKFVVLGAGALAVAGTIKTVLTLVNKNNRTPQNRGGWTTVNFESPAFDTTETID